MLSFADVLIRTKANTEITSSRRRALCYALRRVARLLGENLETLPADPVVLRQRFHGYTPAMAGMRKRQFQVVLSLTNSAIFDATEGVPIRRLGRPRTVEWKILGRALRVRGWRWVSIYLNRLMHFCSLRGISPNDVDDSVIDDFRLWLTEERLARNPRRAIWQACRAWNIAVVRVPGWPRQQLTVPRWRVPVGLLWSAFPVSLEADTQAWLAKLTSPDPFGDGPSRPIRRITAKRYGEAVRHFASGLVHRGWKASKLCSLADLVSIPAFKEGMRHLLSRTNGKATLNTYFTATIMRRIAAEWVCINKAECTVITDIVKSVNPRRHGLSEQTHALLRQFDDTAAVRTILSLPRILFDEATRRDDGSVRCANQAQTAVALELLLSCPMRTRDLCRLRIDRHLHLPVTKRDGAGSITVPAEEATWGVPLHFDLPIESRALIDAYLRKFHHRLSPHGSFWLFPGRFGCKERHLLPAQISNAVRLRTGLDVQPRLLRYLAGKLYLEHRPSDYETVRRLLGFRRLIGVINTFGYIETDADLTLFDTKVLNLRGHVSDKKSVTPKIKLQRKIKPRQIRAKK